MNVHRSALALTVIAALLVSGCPDNTVVAPPRDGGRSDTGMDAAIDAGPVDAAADAAIDAPTFDQFAPDAPFPDGAQPDAFVDDAFVPFDTNDVDMDVDAWTVPIPDAGPCGPMADADVCSCVTLPPDCSSTACPAGSSCLDDQCGRHCYPSGNPCAGASDCATGSTCTGGVCQASGGVCHDSRDCPDGFSCDSGVCHDRRIGCRPIAGLDCPFGFHCNTEGLPYCRRLWHHCGAAADHSPACNDETCSDVDGDGTLECTLFQTLRGAGRCHTNAECTAGQVCSSHPDLYTAFCDVYGPCRTSADCASGMSCVDLWGDGIRECVDAGGTCSRQSDCPDHAVCATPAVGGVPKCVMHPLGV